jgi:hypothetical protein
MLLSPPEKTILCIMSASTVRTVDDVMSVMESNLPMNASLSDSIKFVRRLTKRDTALGNSTIDELEDPRTILSPISSNVSVLITLMARTGAMVGGVQATSFFYPMCEVTDAPWDIYCHCDTADEFLTGYKQSSGCETVDDVRSDDGFRVVHMRRSVSGFRTPANIRILISHLQPMSSILNLKNSYEQTAICAAGAICFWPKLLSRNMYRTFDSNTGVAAYPRGTTFYEVKLNPIRKTHMKRPMQSTEIYTGLDSRVESVLFKNICNVSSRFYNDSIQHLEGIVYAVFNSSTRYIGTTAHMS